MGSLINNYYYAVDIVLIMNWSNVTAQFFLQPGVDGAVRVLHVPCGKRERPPKHRHLHAWCVL